MDSWEQWGKHVLSELDRLSDDVAKASDYSQRDHAMVRMDLAKVREEIAGLKVKAGIWGAISGLIPFLLYWLTKGIK